MYLPHWSPNPYSLGPGYQVSAKHIYAISLTSLSVTKPRHHAVNVCGHIVPVRGTEIS
jgi:hypothetical protein